MSTEISNAKSATVILVIAAITANLPMDKGFWHCDEAIELWQNAWTFSYHHSSDSDAKFIDWHLNLRHFGSKVEAEKAMAAHVWGLNT